MQTKFLLVQPRNYMVRWSPLAIEVDWYMLLYLHFGDMKHRPSGVRSRLAKYSWIIGWRLGIIVIETSSLHYDRYCTVSMTAKRNLWMILLQSYSPDAAWFLLPWSCLLPLLPIAFVWSQSPVSTSHQYLRHAFPNCRSIAFSGRIMSAVLYLTQSYPWKARAWPFGSLADTSPSSLEVSPSMIL